jgi:hypothetical protein
MEMADIAMSNPFQRTTKSGGNALKSTRINRIIPAALEPTARKAVAGAGEPW